MEYEIGDENKEYELDSLSLYFRDISSIKVLSREEEISLFERISNGDEEAKNIVIQSNLKLVIKIAKEYRNSGQTFGDLIQDGNMGLIYAIDKFDYLQGFRFTTYANYWIRQKINIGLVNSLKNIKMPFYVFEKMGEYKRKLSFLQIKLGRFPTDDEVAKEMNISVDLVNKLKQNVDDTVSFNKVIDEDKNIELLDCLALPDEDLEDKVMNNCLVEEVRELLEETKLTEKELNILILRYGFNGNDIHTLEEIGKIYNLSRQRVNQIEKKILFKLRNSNKLYKLAEYMDNSDKSLQNVLNIIDDDKYEKNGKYCIKVIINYFNNYFNTNCNNKELDNYIYKIFKRAYLSDEEIEIIMNRHQFNGRQRLSYKELGQIYNKSTSQVNDMYILAVKKTGMCDDIKKLADIYNEEINAKKRIKRLEK